MHPYKQSGRWQDVLDEYQAHPTIDHTAYMDTWKEYNKTACTNLPEVKHLDVQNISKTL